jgi:hypothetical protein
MLYYLQEKKMRLGKFLIDFLVRKRLRGEEYIRGLECVSKRYRVGDPPPTSMP